MKNILIDISGKIEPGRVAVLGRITEVAAALDIPFFVVGAFARDVVFEHMHHIPAPRLTADIDLGVEVASWDEFRVLVAALIDGDIVSPTRFPHRFIARAFPAVLDILPYGGIAGEAKQLTWPPDHDMVMSMVGFEEAYRSAVKVRLGGDPAVEIMVPSVPALALLKIVSWADAYPQREHDAQDLLFILEHYGATGAEAQLYAGDAALLTEEGFDPVLASVRLLGRDIAMIGSYETVSAVTDILARETDEEGGFRMISHMLKGASFQGVRFEAAWLLLKKLLQGIREKGGP